MKRMLYLLCVLLPGALLADCPRVSGQEDDRSANAGCLILNEDKVLLITHRWGGKLGVPGGTRQADELAQCTAYRETHEETGLDVTVGRRLKVMKNGFHLYDCKLSCSPGKLDVPASGRLEVRAIGWYRLDVLDRESWRFSYQFEDFQQLLREQVGSSVASSRGGC